MNAVTRRASMRSRGMRVCVAKTLALSAAALCAILASNATRAAGNFPPSPYDILRSQDLETPLLDAVPFCVPDGLDAATDPILEQASAGEWDQAREILADWSKGFDRPGLGLIILDGVLRSRAARDREDLLSAEKWLRSLLRRKDIQVQGICLRLELARILLLLSRESEAAAQLTRAEQLLEGLDSPNKKAIQIAFWRAEILYRTGYPFDAHLAYRKITKSDNARLALAARLRLTDLSFDAGKVDQVSREYETLLPRASAYGASTSGWALRAAEAALLAGDSGRALQWLEGLLEESPERDTRDAAEIRLADLDVAFDDPMAARKRLSGISGRRRDDPIGALAAVRAIELGVSPGSPDQRLNILMIALRDQRQGVRRYTLGVLMRELAHRGDLDGALAVATRLAYEGVDPVVNPDYAERLDELLARVATQRDDGSDCRETVRALGGRYGILIERASQPDAFARVGECFEEMELPWLAATLYRSIARRFGVIGAQSIALPLARSSLAIGEVTLARRVATAALEDAEEPEATSWRAILAEADFVDGRFKESAEGLRAVMDAPTAERDRGKFSRLLALTLAEGKRLEDADFLAERVPGWLERNDPAPASRANMIEASMLAAHAYRHAGRQAEATRLYQTVDRHAEAGALRSSARFWLGLSATPDTSGQEAWGEDPNLALGSPWARYALFERHMRPLWASYGQQVQRVQQAQQGQRVQGRK